MSKVKFLKTYMFCRVLFGMLIGIFFGKLLAIDFNFTNERFYIVLMIAVLSASMIMPLASKRRMDEIYNSLK